MNLWWQEKDVPYEAFKSSFILFVPANENISMYQFCPLTTDHHFETSALEVIFQDFLITYTP